MKSLISLLLLLPFALCELPLLSVDNITGRIVNEYGEEVILHGVNVVYKRKPWQPVTDVWSHNASFTEKDMMYLEKWGFNVVRLGVMWPGYSIGQGQYNDTYIPEMKKIVDELGKRGIYTLIDMHQDLLSEYFCGEGVPDHLIKKLDLRKSFPWPLEHPYDKDEKPDRDYCKKHKYFASYYLTLATNDAFAEFYKEDSEMYKELHKFWREVAKAFKGNKNVLGYEFINEPSAGHLYYNPIEFLNLFGQSCHKYLEPLYQSLAKEVIEIDDEHIIVFEASLNALFASGMKRAPGGIGRSHKQIFSYHVYCPFVDWSGCPTNQQSCEVFNNLMFYLRYLDKKYFGCASLLTEFGALSGNDSCVNETHSLLSKADSYNDGWIYWQYKQFDDPTTANMDGTQGFFDIVNGSLHTNKVKALTRPYARKIAGRLRRVFFDYLNEDHKFEVEYDMSKRYTNKTLTELYVNRAYYNNTEPVFSANVDITYRTDNVTEKDSGFEFIKYTIDHGNLPASNTTIKITIKKAS